MFRRFIIVLLVATMTVCTFSTSAFANSSANINGNSSNSKFTDQFNITEARRYALAPDGLIPFIYNGNPPYPWLDIHTDICVADMLYLYDQDQNNVSLISREPVKAYASTLENLFYITSANTIVQTDYSGIAHVVIYASSRGDITNMLTFGQYLTFIEDGQHLVVFNVAEQKASTVLSDVDIVMDICVKHTSLPVHTNSMEHIIGIPAPVAVGLC